MKRIASWIALAMSTLPATVVAQGAPVLLPTSTDVWVVLTEEVSSKGMRVGQRFPVSVSRDVMVSGQVAIPRGTPGIGEVTWRTGKGAFGKSGKMEIQLRSLTLNGRELPIAGRFREEGEGNTGATVGTIVAAGVIAGAFVTGHSAVFEQGRELRGLTVEALPLGAPPMRVAAARPAPDVVAAPTPVAVALSAPVPVWTGGQTDAERYQQKLAAARGVHGREPRLGWTISD